ncbi:unnamed protein product [Lactuca virosa]|uniref:Uncharacterized protein n=1 Tax=Lactuca virosa TaxID=75947 RepID=A0AAU9LGR0_9ASTR|nr:unnamed protein product [Lactuca virosa]
MPFTFLLEPSQACLKGKLSWIYFGLYNGPSRYEGDSGSVIELDTMVASGEFGGERFGSWNERMSNWPDKMAKWPKDNKWKNKMRKWSNAP